MLPAISARALPHYKGAVLRARGLTVRVLLPPPECDWCDVLPEFEERRAIVEEELYG